MGNGNNEAHKENAECKGSFNAAKFKEDHPEFDFTQYERTSNVSGSLLIAV